MAETKSATTKKQKQEAEGNTPKTVEFNVEIKGEEITLTGPADINDAGFDFIVYTEKEKYVAAFAELLSEADLFKLRAAGATVEDFAKCSESYYKAIGLGED
nr:MAG TPA: hypothetical protein [Caudoviricetes sp.]